MKALLKKDYYLCKSLFSGLIIGGLIFLVISKSFMGILSFIMGIAFMNTLSIDTMSSFYSYGMTFPIPSKRFVQVKFVEYLLIILTNLLFLFMTGILFHKATWRETYWILGIVFLIFSYFSLYIPPALMGKRKFNLQKVLILLFPPFLLFIVAFTEKFDSIKRILASGEHYILLIVGCSILLLIISYLWSLAIIKKREY